MAGVICLGVPIFDSSDSTGNIGSVAGATVTGIILAILSIVIVM